MKYKAGDKVWVVCSNYEFNLYGRLPGVVVAPTTSAFDLNDQWYEVELIDHPPPRDHSNWIGREKHLSPRDEDGRQVGAWHASIWKPREKKFNFWEEVRKIYEEEKERG